MAINPIGAVGIRPIELPSLPGTGANGGVAQGGGFEGALGRALGNVQAAQTRADNLTELAATGKLDDVHELTIATSQAQLMTDLTVQVRNKAVEAFNEILRMQV